MSTAEQQTRRERVALHPERLPKVELFLRLTQAQETQMAALTKVCQEYGVTHQQYNVLRILYVRDEGGHGVSCSDIGTRLVTRVPDITRLLDRLAKAGLVDRYRCAGDRRVVRARLTNEGIDLVEKMDAPLIAMHDKFCECLTDDELETLMRLIGKLSDEAGCKQHH